ncbi:class I SAM-dependent methyltransferase [Kutzneria sp. CA-103260]|uniref:class I SAM-dependent methyltransferase n=1 Tax=Kutzneria sp. CA-103260 TaxID=2802641 RepID=UPI001BAA159E|nr:methyltransferase domain-containing protein [Kutzneria sp. CA-103260]QUQ63723.1 methyltransferase [Kutzneria sp. CA-103260]
MDARNTIDRTTRGGALTFLRVARTSFQATGALAPSSRYLAARLAAPLRGGQVRHPAMVLEVGSGTGVVTREIAGLLGPADRLDAVEVNPDFVEVLAHALATDPVLARAADRIRLIPESITAVDLDRRYDVIVSCLPFTNFPPEQVRAILDRYLAALVPGGHLTYFGYLGTQAARSVFDSRTELARHRAVRAVLDEFQQRYGVGSSVVWRNLPPARVPHLQAPAR